MKYTIGIDIGGTNSVFGLVDADGNIIAQNKIKTKDSKNINDYFNALINNITTLINQAESPQDIIAIGIGAPNANAFRGTIEYAPNLSFGDIIELKNELEERLLSLGYDLKVYVTNDANAAAIGEMMYGKAKNGIKNFIMITLGTGVGSGIVVNGKLVYGHTSFAGEIGHTKVCNNGRKCKCGKDDCLETYASATGIVRTALDLLNNNEEPSELREINAEQIDTKIIADAASRGDMIALQCFDMAAKMLSVALANAAAVTSPEKIYLFGGVTQIGDLLLAPLRHYFEAELYVIFKNTIDLELSALKESDAAVLGAAALGIASCDFL
jgi:glucokinase